MAQTTIAIIGATTDSGTAIVNALFRKNYHILLMAEDKTALNRLTASLRKQYKKSDYTVIDCAKEACWEADVVILALLPAEELKAARYIKEVVTQKLVISILSATEEQTPEAGLEKLLPYSKIVKAVFKGNNEFSLSGNDKDALATTLHLLESAGFTIAVSEPSN